MPDPEHPNPCCQRVHERLASLSQQLEQGRVDFREVLESLANVQGQYAQGCKTVDELQKDFDELSRSFAGSSPETTPEIRVSIPKCAVVTNSIGTQTVLPNTAEASIQVELTLEPLVTCRGHESNSAIQHQEAAPTTDDQKEAAPSTDDQKGAAPTEGSGTGDGNLPDGLSSESVTPPPEGSTEPVSVWGRSAEPVEEGEIVQGEPQSIADAVREAAESAQLQTSFVYDSTTGLYYDHNTRYYYDAEKALYYEPYSGTYYHYDTAKGSYEVHSKVDFTNYSKEAYNRYYQNVTGEKDTKKKKKKDKGKKKSENQVVSEQSHVDERGGNHDPSNANQNKPRLPKRKRDKGERSPDRDQRRLVSERNEDSYDDMKYHVKRQKSESHSKIKSEQDHWEAALHKKGRHKSSAERNLDSKDDNGDNENSNKQDGESRGRRKSKDRKKSKESSLEHESTEGSVHRSHKHHKKHKSRDRKKHKHHKKHKMVKKELTHSEGEVNGDSESDMDTSETSDKHSRIRRKRSSKISRHRVKSRIDVENSPVRQFVEISSDGEHISSADSSKSSSSDASEESSTSSEEDITVLSARNYPPCIRVIVKESDTLDVGSLIIITYSGGTIGREKELNHAVLIADENISKMHCDILYNDELRRYEVKDHASQNGTFVNGHRLSKTKSLSEPYPLSNLDTLRVGGSTLELHIHPGTDTCEGCEPGLVQANTPQQELDNTVESTQDKEKLRRLHLKQIKKKYGLANSAYVDDAEAINNPNYSDKAAERRQVVGSDNPYQKDEAPASVNKAISTKNKGHKMLAKMGWKEGEGLGSSQAGITEPIQAELRANQAAGLGSRSNFQRSLDNVHDIKTSQKWIKAQERFNKLQGQSRKQSRGQRQEQSSRMQFIQGNTETFRVDDNSADTVETANPETVCGTEDNKQRTETTMGTISWVKNSGKKPDEAKIQKPNLTAVFNVESSEEEDEKG